MKTVNKIGRLYGLMIAMAVLVPTWSTAASTMWDMAAQGTKKDMATIKRLFERKNDNNLRKYAKKGGKKSIQNSAINKKDEKGMTMLHHAAKNGRIKMVKFLLAHGANPNAMDMEGFTARHYASLRNDFEILLCMFGTDTKINKKNKNDVILLNKENNYGLTLLHWAVMQGNFEIVKYIVEKGANIHKKDINGLTMLHHAAKAGRLEMVKFLLAHGANPNEMDEGGMTPRHYASKHPKMFELMTGTDTEIINKKYKNDITLLEFAVKTLNFGTIKYLIENGASVNEKDSAGLTPLHWAVIFRDLEIVKYLVKNGANVKIKDDSGDTPLDIATERGYRKIVKYLETFQESDSDCCFML